MRCHYYRFSHGTSHIYTWGRFLSTLDLRNYWMEFNETWCKVSLWSVDVQDVFCFRIHKLFNELWPFDYFYIYTWERFLSARNLRNYWMEFNETLCKVSLWSVDVQDVFCFQIHNLFNALLAFEYFYIDTWGRFLSVLDLGNFWMEFNKS